jgi:hypothetical protein
MNTPQQGRASLHYRLIQKLDPSQFPRMSGVMAALIGFILDTAFVEFLGSYADVLRNWLRLIAAAGLSQREFIEAQCLFASKVGFFGPTSA